MTERRRRFDKDRIILYVWMLVLSVGVTFALAKSQSQASVTARTAQRTAAVARITAHIAHTTAETAAVTAKQAKEQCERTRVIAPPLANAYARYHILTAVQLREYRATIPKSCP
jgi:hypothetical protein